MIGINKKSNRSDPPLVPLVALSLIVHLALLRIFLLFPADAVGKQSAVSVQEVKLVYTDEINAANQLNKPEREPTQEKKIDVALLAVPVKIPIVNDVARWIVELKDIPLQMEPENARYVSERPSRVDEEVQAEHASHEPRSSLRRREAGSVKVTQNASLEETQPGRNVVASRVNPPFAPKPEISPAHPSEVGQSNVAAHRENQGTPQKSSRGRNLFPSLGELAQETQSGRPGEPGAVGADRTGGESDLPGMPKAPENFLPLVKKRGPITLLNAKSYTFSAFVRRVANRMFDRFVIGFDPRRFEGSDWTNMQKGNVFEAIMNTNGRLMNIYERRSSGSEEFDLLVRSSVQKGAWDTNIPEGAECADGFVHFMFIPKILPSEPATAANGSKTYSSFYLMAVAGLKECE